MLILLSPSKTIDTEICTTDKSSSQPLFTERSTLLISELRKLTTDKLSKLMSISPKLAQLNYDRYQHWNPNHKLLNSKQAIFSFKGEAYTGLNADSFSDEDLIYAQNHLVILSGLYGMLRPLDLIQPYRLEISTKLAIDNSKNLYAFWSNLVTKQLNESLMSQPNKLLVNLASNEYSKVVNLKKLDANIVTPVFKENKNGSYKIVTVYAKKARGMMTNFIIKNRINTIDEMKFFYEGGYYYNDKLTEENQIVFTRG